jgi:multisubunit Na+/H+ antiporter MnhE subunit
MSVEAVARKEPGRVLIEVFLYLQVLDILSTLIGFSLGTGEASPFIRLLIRWGPVTGLIVSKIFAACLAALCLYLNKRVLIRYINYWYAVLVVWNLATILKVLNAHAGPHPGFFAIH